MRLDDLLNNRGLGAHTSGGYGSDGSYWSETTETTTTTQRDPQSNADPYAGYITDFSAGQGVETSRSGSAVPSKGIVISDGSNVWRQSLHGKPGNLWTLPGYIEHTSYNAATAADALDYWLTQHPFYEVNGAMPSDLQSLYDNYVKLFDKHKSANRNASSQNESYELKKARQDFNDAVRAYASLKYTQALQAGKLLTLQEALAAGDPYSKVFYIKPGYYYIGKAAEIAPTVSEEAAKASTERASRSQSSAPASGQTTNSDTESVSLIWLLLPIAALALSKGVSGDNKTNKRKKK